MQLSDVEKFFKHLKKNVDDPYYGAGIALFYKRDGEVLIGKRKEHPFKGQWSFPGGGLHENETYLDCAYREFCEEMNLQLDNPELRFNEKFNTPRQIDIVKFDFPIFHWETFIMETDIKTVPEGPWDEFSEVLFSSPGGIGFALFQRHWGVMEAVKCYNRFCSK
ncbi:hypothetical protein AGMMS49944_21240 [Spirochaetia bacterium]|nr:hypothetical protein AGMMS49944_21240 [Spirochaetia bacterium]